MDHILRSESELTGIMLEIGEFCQSWYYQTMKMGEETLRALETVDNFVRSESGVLVTHRIILRIGGVMSVGIIRL